MRMVICITGVHSKSDQWIRRNGPQLSQFGGMIPVAEPCSKVMRYACRSPRICDGMTCPSVSAPPPLLPSAPPFLADQQQRPSYLSLQLYACLHHSTQHAVPTHQPRAHQAGEVGLARPTVAAVSVSNAVHAQRDYAHTAMQGTPCSCCTSMCDVPDSQQEDCEGSSCKRERTRPLLAAGSTAAAAEGARFAGRGEPSASCHPPHGGSSRGRRATIQQTSVGNKHVAMHCAGCLRFSSDHHHQNGQGRRKCPDRGKE